MEPFKVSPHLAALLDSYPDAKLLVNAAINGGQHGKAAIARLWLSEGIPFAFKDAPALYESVRAWLGVRLDVDPKEIHLTGSARIGQSLAPRKIGTSFGSHSDLDLFVVSQALFDRIKTDFNSWSFQFEGGLARIFHKTKDGKAVNPLKLSRQTQLKERPCRDKTLPQLSEIFLTKTPQSGSQL